MFDQKGYGVMRVGKDSQEAAEQNIILVMSAGGQELS